MGRPVLPFPALLALTFEESCRKLLKIDYGGALLTIAASVLLILPLNWGGTSFPWVSGPVLGCLLSGVAAFALFFFWEWKFAKIPVAPRKSFLSFARRTLWNRLC